ncbi:MAG: methyl-accepting chemotaxis protein [Bacteroidales bacterium]|nr:methyl-accepting chemotaxis protein [Bacteroidales bacterium]
MSNTKNKKKTIWARYMKLITPAVMAIVIIMNIIVYLLIAENTRNAISGSCYRTVQMEADIIDNVIYRYVSDLNILSRSYTPNDIEGFLDYARKFTNNHVNQYSYVRIWTPEGISYTTLEGRDTTDATWRKPYKQIKEQGKDLCINMAHSSREVGYDVFTISIPVKNKKAQLIGIICAAFPADVIDSKLILENSKGAAGFLALVDDEFHMRLYHEKIINSEVEVLVKKGFAELDNCIYDGFKEYNSKHLTFGSGFYYTPDGWKMACHFTKIGNTGCYLALNIPNILLNMDIYKIMGILAITGILTIIVVLLLIRNITKKVIIDPITSIDKFTQEFAQGKLYSTAANDITSKDEIGSLKNNVQNMQSRLVEVVESIHKSTSEVSECTSKIKDTVFKISEDALVQSACVNDMQNSVENITQSIQQNTQMASDAKMTSDEIAGDIDIVTMASDNTLESIQDVINKIKVINEISTRTDLLAINASVEASRAGENGKGFAVVAAEIRKLAEHCQKASTEINEMSSNSLLITQQSAELIENISPKIRENAEKIAAISETCNQQLNMTMNISQSIMQLVDITSNNSQSSDEMQVSTQILYKDLEDLNKTMAFFQIDNTQGRRRQELIQEIEKHTSEILKLKTQLVAVAESKEESSEADNNYNEAIETAKTVTLKDVKEKESSETVAEDNPEAAEPQESNTGTDEDFFKQNTNTGSQQIYISKTDNKKLDSGYESY